MGIQNNTIEVDRQHGTSCFLCQVPVNPRPNGASANFKDVHVKGSDEEN